MIAKRKAPSSIEEALDICYLGEDAAVLVEETEWSEEDND